MAFSIRHIASQCKWIGFPFSVRQNILEKIAYPPYREGLRQHLPRIVRYYLNFSLPPKIIETHPRLSPIPAIHFDQYNSCITNLDAPDAPGVEATLIKHGKILGTCLNFLQDNAGSIYGFCGNLSSGLFDGKKGVINVKFKLALFDQKLRKVDEFGVVEFPSRQIWWKGDLPINLGYFVMDNEGRVIIVKNKTQVVFVKNLNNKLRAVMKWDLSAQLRVKLGDKIADQSLAQVLPKYDHGYWVMALGKKGKAAFVGLLSNNGTLKDVHVFRFKKHGEMVDEVIENGMAIDNSGVYIVTDYRLYKLTETPDQKIRVEWQSEPPYERSRSKKPGTISKFGSGSTPTLFGKFNDLVAFTDNANPQVNLLVHHRQNGRLICKIPLFSPNRSANENSVLAYGDSVVVQNWYNSPAFDDDMWGLEPGLTRFDVHAARQGGYRQIWHNSTFATTATIRLSTKTGLLYGAVQTSNKRDGEKYKMAFVDFHTGKLVRQVKMGSGRDYRISMAPSYIIPGGRLLQPVRKGVVVFKNK